MQTAEVPKVTADAILEAIFKRTQTEEDFIVFGSGEKVPRAEAVKGPSNTQKDALEDLLTPVSMGLDAGHLKDWATEVKKTFAASLHKLAFFTPAEGAAIIITGNRATASSLWTTIQTGNGVNFIFSVNGHDGARQLGLFIQEVLDLKDYAGFTGVAQALYAARRHEDIAHIGNYLRLKANPPTATADERDVSTLSKERENLSGTYRIATPIRLPKNCIDSPSLRLTNPNDDREDWNRHLLFN